MSKVLVTYNSNWADEMDISAFRIFDKPDWDAIEKFAKEYKNEICVCIGTNEEVEFTDGNDWLSKMEVKVITDKDANIIEKHIGDSFGFDNIIDKVAFMPEDDISEEDAE